MRIFYTFCLAALLPASGRAADAFPVSHPGGVIVFQGDSITDGGRARKGNDLNHTMGQSYAYLISARIGAEFPERNLLFLNRGNSGNRVPDLAARWQGDALALKPDLLSILIGVNGAIPAGPARPGNSAEEYERDYDRLLADTRAALPGVKIVLGEPFLLPVGGLARNFPAARASIEERQKVVARLAAKYKLPLVKYQQAFDAACEKAPAKFWLWDGVHPTYAGHWLMAEEWLRTVNAFWPAGS